MENDKEFVDNFDSYTVNSKTAKPENFN